MSDIQQHRLRIPAAGVRYTPEQMLAEFKRRPRRRNVVFAQVSDGALVVGFRARPDEVDKRARYLFCDIALWPNNSSADGKYEVVAEDPERPEAPCGCGYDLIWINGDWEHDAAPSLWGDDHDPDAPEPIGPARVFWDDRDGVTTR